MLPKLIPREVVDLAGKNSPVALSVSRMDSDTLSVSRLNSVRVPIPVVTNPFGGPRKIPNEKKDGVFFGQFLPQVPIPADHPRGDEIRRAAAFWRASPAYKERSDYIEHRIWILVGMDPSKVTHHAEAIAKCPTIRLGVSDECFTYCNPGANMNECPSFRATHACSDGLPPTGIDYGNGFRFCVTNARIICRSKNGHCHIWTVAEGKMMAGILIVYIRVLISWKITCVIFNLGGTRASVAFFDAFDVKLGTLLPAQRAFVRVEKAGTHVSNFDWRRPTVWSMPEYQIETVSQSAKDTGHFLRRFFLQVASPNCILRGIVEPHGPSFFDTLVEDNLRARYVQDISTFEYSGRLEELAGFFRDQRWKHMHHVLRSQGITLEEQGRRGGEASIEAIVASLEADGFTRIEALREIGLRLRGESLASLEAQGFTGEDGTATASTELGRRGRGGALASREAQGVTGEGGAASASYELSRRGGETSGENRRRNMKCGSCIYPGCKYSINTGEFCKQHRPIKPVVEKSDKCRVCGRVLGMEKRVRGGVCNACYCKPEAKAARKKATAEKKVARGTCSTPGCNGINDRGRDKCYSSLYPRKSK